ncbi:fungal-specific transcription factor domain-containing protein [Aspergillus fruticulosus]
MDSDLPRRLAELQERLGRAEALLALPGAVPAAGYPWLSHSPCRPFSEPELPVMPDVVFQDAPDESGKGSWCTSLEFFGLPELQTPAATEEIGLPSQPSSHARVSDDAEQPPDLIALYRNYFEIFYPTLPILNQQRFFSEIAHDPNHPPTQCLSYAVALMGSMVAVVQDHGIQNQCCRLARQYAELCERNEHHADLNLFQSLVFILRYELDGQQLTRAWMTLGRAIRLAQVLDLNHLDRPASICRSSWGFHVALPTTQEQGDLEERRRAFWALYILETYTSMRAGIPCHIDLSQVQVNLASPGELGPDFEATHMPLLTENVNLTPATHITSYSGLVLMATLARQCMRHVLQSTTAESDSPSPGSGFWDRHYTLSQAINDRMAGLQSHLSAKASREDPAAFSLLVNLCAVDLYLQEAAIDQAERQDLPPSVVAESRRRCSADALKIASTIRMNYPTAPQDGDMLALQRTFIGWPLVMSMRALWRELRAATDLTADGVAGSLRFLSGALDAIEEENGYWHHLVAGVGVTLQKWEEEHDGFGSLLRQDNRKRSRS